MTSTSSDSTRAFRLLEQRLRARRFAGLDTRLRALLAILTLLLGAFTFWQVRIPLDQAYHRAGALAALQLEALVLAGIALAAGTLAHWRQSVLVARLPGPEWLALPVHPAVVARHLQHEARVPAVAMAPLAAAAWLAGLDRLPWLWSALLAVAFMVAWLECTRLGAAVARFAMSRGDAASAALPRVWRLLISGRRQGRTRAVAPARWTRTSTTGAIVALDRVLTLRAAAPRARAGLALFASALASLAWISGAEPMLARAQAFVGFAFASCMLGAWAICRVCGDPPDLLRPLPLSVGTLWRARFVQLAAGLAVLALLQSVFAASFPLPARIGQFVSWFVPGLAIATLGLHYAITLHPRANIAENLYYGWLGVALCASLMIPFLGWGVLLAGLVHSSLRLSRWYAPEVS